MCQQCVMCVLYVCVLRFHWNTTPYVISMKRNGNQCNFLQTINEMSAFSFCYKMPGGCILLAATLWAKQWSIDVDWRRCCRRCCGCRRCCCLFVCLFVCFCFCFWFCVVCVFFEALCLFFIVGLLRSKFQSKK